MGNFLRPNKGKLQNPQHYEFMNAFLTVLASSGLSAAKITALVSQLTSAFQDEDRWYMQARASELIAQRNEADSRRDNFYARLHRLAQVWAGSGDPTMDAAATLLLRPFDLYKVKTTAQIEVESGQLSNLINDLLAAEMQTALTTLHGTYLFQQMKAAHELVQSIRLQEGAEQSEKVTGALAIARKACDALYDQITYLIEAYTMTADDPAPYDAFVALWNGTLKIYQDMLDRKSGTPTGGVANPDLNPNTGGGTTPNPGTGGGDNQPTPDPSQGDGSQNQGGDQPTPDPSQGDGSQNQGGDQPTPNPSQGDGSQNQGDNGGVFDQN